MTDKAFRVRKGLSVEGATTVTGHVTPTTNGTIDLGNTGNRFANVHANNFFGNGAALTGISATPGGANTQVQFNDSTAFGGSAGLTFDKVANNVFVANTLTVGANVTIVDKVLVGNSTVNSVTNSTSFSLANSTLAINVGPADVRVGANVIVESARIFVGNSTQNVVVNTSGVTTTNLTGTSVTMLFGPTSVKAGANIQMLTNRFLAGNTSVNATINSTSLVILTATSDTGSLTATAAGVGNTVANVAVTSTSVTVQNSTLAIIAGPGDVRAGANSIVSPTSYFVGNSTQNTTVAQVLVTVANSTSTLTADPNKVITGNSTVNAVVNSTALTVSNSTLVVSVGPAQVGVGSNTIVNTSALSVGNSTVNVVTISTQLLIANSTGNGLLTSATVSFGNTTDNSSLTSSLLSMANSTQSTAIAPGVVNVTTSFFIGDSTTNTVTNTFPATKWSNSTQVAVVSTLGLTVVDTAVTGTRMSIGTTANMQANSTTMRVADTVANVTVNSSSIKINSNTTANITIVGANSIQSNGSFFLNGNGSFSLPTAAATPGGANTNVQYNLSGAMAGGAGFTFNGDTNTVVVSNTISVGNSTVNSVVNSSSLVISTATSGTMSIGNSTVNTMINSTSLGTGTADGNTTILSGNATIQGNSTTNTGRLSIVRYSSASGPFVGFYRSQNNTPGQHESTADGVDTVTISGSASNGTAYQQVGTLRLQTDGATNSSAAGAIWIFSTANTTSLTVTTRARIWSTGELQVPSPGFVTVGDGSTGTYSQVTNNVMKTGNSTVNVVVDATGFISAATVTAANGTLAEPTTPVAKVFVANIASRPMLAMAGNTTVGPSAHAFQPWLGHKDYQHVDATWNATTLTAIGCSTNVSAAPAPTARALATGNTFLSTKRLGLVTSAAAGNTVTVKGLNLSNWRGNAAGLGGFTMAVRIGGAAITTGSRAFAGMKDSVTTITNGALTSQTNIIGIGFDSADTAWKMLSANATVVNAISLGTGFPCNSNTVDMLDVVIHAPPNGGTVAYRVTNLKDGNVASGTFNQTNLPTTTTTLCWHVWVNSGSNGTATGVDLAHMYVETDF